MDYNKAIKDAISDRANLSNRILKELSESQEGIALKAARIAYSAKEKELWNKYSPELDSIGESIRQFEILKKEQKLNRFLDPKAYGDYIELYYQKVFMGTDWRERKKLVWVSDNRRNFVVVIPGHKYFGGIGSQNYYGIHYFLFKVNPEKAGSVSQWDKSCLWNKQGRLSESDWDDINRLGND